MSQRHIPDLESILADLRKLEARARLQSRYCRTDDAADIPEAIKAAIGAMQIAAEEIEAAAVEVGHAIAEERRYIVQDQMEYA